MAGNSGVGRALKWLLVDPAPPGLGQRLSSAVGLATTKTVPFGPITSLHPLNPFSLFSTTSVWVVNLIWKQSVLYWL